MISNQVKCINCSGARQMTQRRASSLIESSVLFFTVKENNRCLTCLFSSGKGNGSGQSVGEGGTIYLKLTPLLKSWAVRGEVGCPEPEEKWPAPAGSASGFLREHNCGKGDPLPQNHKYHARQRIHLFGNEGVCKKRVLTRSEVPGHGMHG